MYFEILLFKKGKNATFRLLKKFALFMDMMQYQEVQRWLEHFQFGNFDDKDTNHWNSRRNRWKKCE